MNGLVDPLKNIARDLVEKKLWPVAVALLLAIVAVPMLIGGSDEPASAPAPVVATPASPESKSLVSVVDTAAVAAPKNRAGKIADPFYDPPEPPKEDTTPTQTSAPTATKPAEGVKEGGTPAPATPVEPLPTEPAQPVAAPVYYRTVARWYENTESKPRPLARLTPLGGLADTAALYLGVTKSSGSYAVFLLGANATSEGEAACEDDTNCRVIGLKSGQTQLVTVTPPEGGEARQYTLEVVSVRAVATDAADARSKRHKVHPDGRDVMREMWMNPAIAQVLGPIQYDASTGLLQKSASAPAAKASSE